jgi:hypothetical protein
LWCFQNDFFSWTECSCENVHSLKPLDNKQFLHFNFNCWFGFVATQKVEMWNQLHLCSKQKAFRIYLAFESFLWLSVQLVDPTIAAIVSFRVHQSLLKFEFWL